MLPYNVIFSIQLTINGQEDSKIKELSKGIQNSSQYEKDFVLFGFNPMTPWIPSFKGEVGQITVGYSHRILSMNQCVVGKFNHEPNYTIYPTGGDFKESDGLSSRRADVCDVPSYVVVLPFNGTYREHDTICKSLYGQLIDIDSSRYDKLSNEIKSQCDQRGSTTFWSLSYTNDELDNRCFMMFGNEINRIYCYRQSSCSLCNIPKNIEVYLFGQLKFFDRKFKMIPDKRGMFSFNGSLSSMSRNNGLWELNSLVSEEKLVYEGFGIPLGRKNWTLLDPLMQSNTSVMLTISLCLEEEFSCSNGECLGIPGARCNGKVECVDASDEYNCDFVDKDPGYQEKQMPTSRELIDGEVIDVTHLAYHLDIKFISDLHSTDGKFTIDFVITVRWIDGRLTLKNIKSNFFQGTGIWTPDFLFFSTFSDGDLITIKSQTKKMSARLIVKKNLAPNFNDSFMGEYFLAYIYVSS